MADIYGNTESSNKKILIVGIGLLVLILICVAGYFLWQRQNNQTGNQVTGSGSFGEAETVDGVGEQSSGGDNIPSSSGTMDGETKKFFLLSERPVAGAAFITDKVDGGNKVRFVTKEDGFVHDVPAEGGDITTLTNTTIPRVHEALITKDGGTILYRYTEGGGVYQTIKSYLADLVPGDEGWKLGGKFLPDNISEVSLQKNSLFYLLPFEEGISGSTVDIRSKETKEILRHEFSEWLPYQTSAGVLLATKPSYNVPGFVYRYDQKLKGFERIMRSKKGLTILPSSNNKSFLFSEMVGGTTQFGVKGSERITGDEGIDLGDEQLFNVVSLPEKCVWSNNEIEVYCASIPALTNTQVPDAWYRGEITLPGVIWRLNSKTGESVLLGDPNLEVGRDIDAIHLFLSLDEKILYFGDKKTDQLWGMHIRIPSNEDSLENVSPEDIKDIEGSMR